MRRRPPTRLSGCANCWRCHTRGSTNGANPATVDRPAATSSTHPPRPTKPKTAEHVAVLVDRAPQVMDGAVDLDENLVEVPFVAGAGSAPAQLVGVVRPELGTPGADRLVGDHDTAGQHQLLDVAQGQRKPVIQPHRVPDDFDRIPISPCILPQSPQRRILAAPHLANNLTMPLEVLGDEVEAAAERGIGGALPIRDLLNGSRRIPAVSQALDLCAQIGLVVEPRP